MVYQWTYKAASAVADVTASHTEDLARYPVDFEGKNASEVREGYVFRITLREGMKWQNGEEITADDYIESFKRLLDPKMQNKLADSYISGDTAVAGAKEFNYSGRTLYEEGLIDDNEEMVMDETGVYTFYGRNVFIAVDAPLDEYLSGASLYDYRDYLQSSAIRELHKQADENGNVLLTEESFALLVRAISTDDWAEDESFAHNYLLVEKYYPETDWDIVGLYKLDDYDLIYVAASYCELGRLLSGLTKSWLVNTELYDDNLYAEGTKTDYGTDVSNTISFGPYVLSSCSSTQMVFTKNASYFAFTYDTASGRYKGISDWSVNGDNVEVYQADKVVIKELTDNAAKKEYDKGELDIFSPKASEAKEFSLSENLYKEDETFVMRLFFNTDISALQNMDENEDNENSVVLSNDSFRKAFSLAIDRSEWVSTTYGYKQAFYLLNNIYYYDYYNDPSSVFRRSEQAMRSMCDMYGIPYGTGQRYETLQEAYDSISGYDLDEARSLMDRACGELIEAGLYTEGEPITIQVAWKKDTLEEEDYDQVSLLQDYLNTAAEGSGFGRITLEANYDYDRYASVPQGRCAIGYGAWGGAALNPFAGFRVYCDPDYSRIHEGACWDPAEEELTINIDGEERTETYQWWSGCLITGGEYEQADISVKLQIAAELEKSILERNYCIPLATSTICTLTSDKVDYYTHDYSTAYGFGGVELLRFNYNDKEWDAHIGVEPVLEAPSVTTSKNYGNGILVEWDEVEGATGYVVYRRAMKSGETNWTAFARGSNTTELSFLDTKVYEGTKYQYGIKAYYGDDPQTTTKLGPVGPMSTAVIYSKKPEAPTKTTTKNTDNGIEITWDAVKGAAGYVIYRRAWSSTTNGWTEFQRWNNTTSTTWTDTKVYAGTKYQYGIKAYYGDDPKNMTYVGSVGPLSTNVRITTRKINSLTASGDKATVKWDASSVFTGYQVQYADNASFSSATLKTVSDPKTATLTVSLGAGKTYYFRVRSYYVYNNIKYYGAWSTAGGIYLK